MLLSFARSIRFKFENLEIVEKAEALCYTSNAGTIFFSELIIFFSGSGDSNENKSLKKTIVFCIGLFI
jgi:hypothetical protein